MSEGWVIKLSDYVVFGKIGEFFHVFCRIPGFVYCCGLLFYNRSQFGTEHDLPRVHERVPLKHER